MPKPIVLAFLMLAGCASVPAAAPAPGSRPGPIAANPAGGTCDAAGGQAFLGQLATEASGQAILAATHAKILRWQWPGMMMTMEFSAERVDVRYGPDLRILAVTCG